MNQDEKLLRHIANGISDLTPERGEALWNAPAAPATGSEWYLDGTGKKANGRPLRYGALAACLVLCLTVTMLFRFMPSASVYLDVNPSVELKVNYSNRVTGAIPRNAEAEEILADMELRGTDLDVALYAILGSMVHHGYLTQAQDTILISVYSPNTTRAASLEVQVSDMVTQTLDQMIQSGEVLTHQLQEEDHKNDDDTPGKSAFIDDLEEKYPQLEEADLDSLTVDEIVSLLEKDDLDYSDYKDQDDDDDDDDEDIDDDDNDEDDDD